MYVIAMESGVHPDEFWEWTPAIVYHVIQSKQNEQRRHWERFATLMSVVAGMFSKKRLKVDDFLPDAYKQNKTTDEFSVEDLERLKGIASNMGKRK
jgi:hypothetical protein